jgi:hypothetical protein
VLSRLGIACWPTCREQELVLEGADGHEGLQAGYIAAKGSHNRCERFPAGTRLPVRLTDFLRIQSYVGLHPPLRTFCGRKKVLVGMRMEPVAHSRGKSTDQLSNT